MPDPKLRLSRFALVGLLTACWTPSTARESADRQVYDILERTNAAITGNPVAWPLPRRVDSLRARLLANHGLNPDGTPVRLTLTEAFDVAAENSREFQRQKEVLYAAALTLTRNQWDFAVRFGNTGSERISGTGDDTANASLGDTGSVNYRTPFGTRIVGSFAQTFLRSVVQNGRFDGNSILNLSLTQPLLAGSGMRIVREPLTQAERNVLYAVRSFERFRFDLAIGIASDYWNLCGIVNDLANIEANYTNVLKSREQVEEFFKAGRRTIVDFGRAKQAEYGAGVTLVNTRNRLQTALDRFKLRLGLPTSSHIEVDPKELDRLKQNGVAAVPLTEDQAVGIALQRRYDYHTAIDEVEDSGRRIYVAADALRSLIDFTTAISVPAESGRGVDLDWSRINWSAGFDLNLALDRIAERNAYRSALINFDVAIRAREQAGDQITANVRAAMRNIQVATENFHIQTTALALAKQRVEATTDLYDAGRIQILEKLQALEDFLSSQLSLNSQIVAYSVARFTLLNEMQAVQIDPAGLQVDLALPIPQPATAE